MYFIAEDANYWYEVHGASGTPLVLLHGFTGSTKTWEFFVREKPDDVQLILIDLPGHGKTETAGLISMEQCVDDLRRLFDALGLKQVHLAGYSMGGRTALSFAMLYPEYITSLILESASPGLADADDRKARVDNDEQLAKKLETDGIRKFVDFWENIPLFSSQKKLPEPVRKSIRNGRLNQSAEGLAASLRSMGTGKQPSWWHLLAKIRFPVLLLVGGLDAKYVAINKKMHTEIPASELVIVEEAGHAVHIEETTHFIQHIIRFISN